MLLWISSLYWLIFAFQENVYWFSCECMGKAQSHCFLSEVQELTVLEEEVTLTRFRLDSQ